MDERMIFEAARYAEYGNAVVDTVFQIDEGYRYEDRFNGINLSSLFSFLIREAGRLCDNYASDMFYELKAIEQRWYGKDSVLFNSEEIVDGTYDEIIIGIRESGVDGMSFIKNRTDSFIYTYRELIRIRADKKENGMWRLQAYRVSPSSMDHFFEKERRNAEYGL